MMPNILLIDDGAQTSFTEVDLENYIPFGARKFRGFITTGATAGYIGFKEYPYDGDMADWGGNIALHAGNTVHPFDFNIITHQMAVPAYIRIQYACTAGSTFDMYMNQYEFE